MPDQNICIEFDGIQHFRPVAFFGGQKSFNHIQENDLIKTEYCLINNIKLIRIGYNDIIINKLQEELYG